jgi:GAF domain-containing protein
MNSTNGSSGGLAEQLSTLARTLEKPSTLQDTLDVIVASAADTIPGTQHASITSVERRATVRTLAATGDLPRRTDQAQYDTAQGPCLDTLYERKTVSVPRVGADDRWPAFAAAAGALGAGSMLCVQLFVQGDDLGALNLLSAEPDAFGPESEELALLFATHAAIAMAGAEQQDDLRRGMATRDVIGQAKGVLMERHKISSDQAFALMVRASQSTQRKLREIAEELALTGQLPER